jgi:hypothetical protein
LEYGSGPKPYRNARQLDYFLDGLVMHGALNQIYQRSRTGRALRSNGVAAIRNGYCDKEQGEAVGCMEANMR